LYCELIAWGFPGKGKLLGAGGENRVLVVRQGVLKAKGGSFEFAKKGRESTD